MVKPLNETLMKKLYFILLVFPALVASAQTRISFKKTPNTLKPVVEKVARDYYQNFNNIKGDTINETESTIEFTSKVAPADALVNFYYKIYRSLFLHMAGNHVSIRRL